MSKKNVEWEWKKLGDVCDFNSGYTPKKNELLKEGLVPYFKVSDMNRVANSLFMIESDLYVINPKKIFKRNSIVFPKNGGAVFTNKKRILAQESVIDLNSQSISTKKENTLSTSFLYLFFQTIDLKDFSKGAALPTLEMSLLKNIEISIPPLDEQERIVKVLDDAFEKIDVIKITAETNLQNAKDLFQTTLANELSITDEKIKQGWEEKTLDDCCEITSILVDPKETKYRKLLHVGGANIESETGRLLDLQTAEEENLISGKFLFDDTMILYSKIRPYLKKIVQPDFSGLCSADIYPLNVKRNMNKGFLFYTLFSEPFTDFANKNSARAGMPKINRESLFAYKFFLPPLPIQKQIVAKLDSLSEKVKQLESNYKQVLADCDELKKALLKQAFEGML